jgi:osmoprotectant transport system permease protein
MTPDEPLVRWEWFGANAGEIVERLGEHLMLAGIALAVGFAISFALALAARRWPVIYPPTTWTAGILYTIPSLALFAFLVPFTGLSLLTAEIGLVGYTLNILLRNIVTGLRGVPADVREAALGMGYTGAGLLLRVELPLALGAILAGLRIAAVTTIELVTVTALIGQGGLGFFIIDGIQRFFATPLLVGAVLSIVLAVLADAALVMVQRAATPWARVTR